MTEGARAPAAGGWRPACPLADLLDGTPAHVDLDGVPVCLVRRGDRVHAVRDECTHEDIALSEGDVEDGTIECWAHGSRFDLVTGEALNPPATVAVAVYPAQVDADGTVRVDLSDAQR